VKQEVTVPKLGDTTESVMILKWLCAPGEAVTEGQPLAEAETDKADADIPSPVAGTLVEQLVPVGSEVDVGAPLCVIEV
jgi:pyruvate/2-oxoglutarate dehydrogenase complex dihydrolipoamide acyltransferase (E2) component